MPRRPPLPPPLSGLLPVAHAAGWTLGAVAAACRVDPATLRRWLRLPAGHPGTDAVVQAIYRATGLAWAGRTGLWTGGNAPNVAARHFRHKCRPDPARRTCVPTPPGGSGQT